MDDLFSNPTIVDVDYSVKEYWIQRKPQMGDHIRVMRIGGLYAHHGVYVSDDEVIHFTGKEDDSILDWSKPEVISSDLDYFLKGGVLEVKVYTDEEFVDLYSPEQIVTYARACLGDKGYNLAFNNCEHFANVCTLGRFRSNQVERVLLGKFPNEEDKKMGLFETVGKAIKSLFSNGRSHSNGGSVGRSTTTYEPDKVKIAEAEANAKVRAAEIEANAKVRAAEIEANAKARVAEIEADSKAQQARTEIERIELEKEAQLDYLRFQAESQKALIYAQTQGASVMAQTIISFQEKMDELAKNRLLIIENATLPIIRDIETFYVELQHRIEEDNFIYDTEKLPALLALLEKYEESSPVFNLYYKKVEDDIASQAEHYRQQIAEVAQRQTQVISGFMDSKKLIVEQTKQITAKLVDTFQQQTLQINSTTFSLQGNSTTLLTGQHDPALPGGANED